MYLCHKDREYSQGCPVLQSIVFHRKSAQTQIPTYNLKENQSPQTWYFNRTMITHFSFNISDPHSLQIQSKSAGRFYWALTGCWRRLQSETGRMGPVVREVWPPLANLPHWSETHMMESHTPQSWTGNKSLNLKTPPAGPLGSKKIHRKIWMLFSTTLACLSLNIGDSLCSM